MAAIRAVEITAVDMAVMGMVEAIREMTEVLMARRRPSSRGQQIMVDGSTIATMLAIPSAGPGASVTLSMPDAIAAMSFRTCFVADE